MEVNEKKNRIEALNESFSNLGNGVKSAVLAAGIIMVLIKLICYYRMMGVQSCFVIITLITFAATAALFLVFKRKWIFGIIYFLISVLMVVDVNYYSFFNRNLSIGAAGAADLLGGVTESIKEIFMPHSLLLLLDAAVLLAFFIVMRSALMNPKWDIWKKITNFKVRYVVFGIGWLLLGSLILIVPADNSVGATVFSQEYYSYHIRDITGINPVDSGKIDIDDVLAIKGNYSQEKAGKDFGCAEGMNLIVVQIEAMQNFVINRTYNGQEITPFINSLLKEDSIYFDTYYQQTGGGNTSDAEFASNNSFYGTIQSYTYKLFQNNYWYGLPWILKEKGYSTQAFHGYDGDYWNRAGAYPNMGFDTFYDDKAFEKKEILGMGLSDRELFDQSVDILATGTASPFYAFMITLSSHYPFDIGGKLELSKEDEGTMFGDYIQSMNYVDSCLEHLFEKLKEEGMYENTMVAFYGDHLGMNPKTDDVKERMSDFLGWEYDYEDAMNIPLVIHIPGLGESRTISTPGGQTDFMPTVSYLMGIEDLNTLYMGHNLCTVKSNFVPVRSYVSYGSFITGDIMFKMGKGNTMADAEAVNIRTHEKLDANKYESYYRKSLQLQNSSDYYVINDIMRKVLKEGIPLEEAIGSADDNKTGYYSSLKPPSVVKDAMFGEGKTAGVYCVENFERLYEEGERAFALKMIWTVEKETVVMNSWDDLDKYFKNTKDIYSYDTLRAAMDTKAKDGITVMTGDAFLEWAMGHPDCVFYITLDDSIILGGAHEDMNIYFARDLLNNYPGILDRTIFVANDEYALNNYNMDKLYNVLFRADDSLSVKEIIKLATKYEIYGAARSIEKAEKLKDDWTFDNYAIYGYTDDESDIEKADRMGLNGIVITP